MLDDRARPPVSSAVHERACASTPAFAPRPTFDVVGGRLGTSSHGNEGLRRRIDGIATDEPVEVESATRQAGVARRRDRAPRRGLRWWRRQVDVVVGQRRRRGRRRDHDVARIRRAGRAGRGAKHRARLAEGPGRRVPGGEPEHQGRHDLRQLGQRAREADGRAAGQQGPRPHLPVRHQPAAARNVAQGGRPDRARGRRRLQLGRLPGRRAGRLHHRRQGDRGAGAGRQPRGRLQQGAVRHGRPAEPSADWTWDESGRTPRR